ncbi:hypothetical protein PMIN01_01004 [Paraphaeosphaeria minitans]|uniref:Uncharacterized protein n=1 Tax=Paraphaeosphaeria minitans TaxID=565426 RepID=A0A9P6GUQ0_9PLEO|nr:hypothetical protein PMIN01_01004 [Paraphaeosphaeria minitans]
MHSFLTLALTLLLLPLTTTQDTPPRECNDASTAVCCPSLASNASGPCGANAEPVRNVTECTQEKYPQGWACCIDKVRVVRTKQLREGGEGEEGEWFVQGG